MPALYGVIETQHDIRTLPDIVRSHNEFALKPAHGSAGDGIVVIAGRSGNALPHDRRRHPRRGLPLASPVECDQRPVQPRRRAGRGDRRIHGALLAAVRAHQLPGCAGHPRDRVPRLAGHGDGAPADARLARQGESAPGRGRRGHRSRDRHDARRRDRHRGRHASSRTRRTRSRACACRTGTRSSTSRRAATS